MMEAPQLTATHTGGELPTSLARDNIFATIHQIMEKSAWRSVYRISNFTVHSKKHRVLRSRYIYLHRLNSRQLLTVTQIFASE